MEGKTKLAGKNVKIAGFGLDNVLLQEKEGELQMFN